MMRRARDQSISWTRQRPAGNQARGWDSRIVRSIRHDPQRVTASITLIKVAHSLIFVSMAASILYTFYSGLTNRISRLTTMSIAAVIGEGLIFLMHKGRCPLTDLVEDLGSEHGSVSDIFLPTRFAARIPILFSPLFAIGLAAIGARRVRRQPVVATLSATVAALFLAIPWLFQLKERQSGQRYTG
jgi:hypothetical protein